MPSHKRLITALLAAFVLLGLGASAALASTTQQSILTDPVLLQDAPASTILEAKAVGFTMVKLPVQWNNAVPSPHSTKEPAGFNPTSASSYLPSFFTWLSGAVADAQKDGVTVGFQLEGPGPVWAQSSSAPAEFKSASYYNNGIWEPNDTLFEDFVRVIAAKYPTVKWFSVWNEPNYGTNLAPELTDRGKVDEGAILYRGLLDAAYKGLSAAGKTVHNSTIAVGELAPRFQSGTSLGGERPLEFLDDLYGVSTSGKRLTGSAAKTYGVNASASAFRADNPVLFSGNVAIHPYEQGVAPDVPTYTCGGSACWNGKTKKSDPYFADLAEVSRLESTLDRNAKADGSGSRPSIWNTEFGYSYTGAGLKTCHGGAADCALPIATAAYYDNWAEYLSYENPRLASFDQYQLIEPAGSTQTWADGLFSNRGKPTALLEAFEEPLFVPTTTLKKAGDVSLWGGVKPAVYDSLTYGLAKKVAIQFAAKGSGYKTLKTVSIGNARGYFTAKVAVAKSGTLRLVYGSGSATLVSRSQAITVK